MSFDFATIETVPLKDMFSSEANSGGFTDWLANYGGLKLLSSTLGFDLDFEGQEVSTGQFRADIVGRLADNSIVVIENQIKEANFEHLGKCLTYASAYEDCKTIIWIASQFNEEHKRTIDWLNRSWDSISFYAVEIKLLKIDGSRIAANFNVVCQPDIGSRAIHCQEFAGEREKFQILFWQDYVEALSKVKVQAGYQVKPSSQYYINVHSQLVRLNPRVQMKEGRVAIGILINYQPDIEKVNNTFAFLESHKQEIESAVNDSFNWSPEGASVKVITLTKDGFDFDNEESRKAAIDWLVEKTVKLNKCLRKLMPKIKENNLTAQDSEDEQE